MGLVKNNGFNISLRLNYNVYDSIKNAPKIPNVLFRCDVKNNDEENLALGRKHSRKSKKMGDWYVGRELRCGAFGQVKMGINSRALEFIDIEMDKQKHKNIKNQLLTFIASEITNIQNINHDNVISLLAFNLNVDNKIMLVFEYAIYGELYQLIKHGNKRRVNFEMAKHILSQILSGLNECHSIGIMHKDIKPQNIFVTRNYLPNNSLSVSGNNSKSTSGGNLEVVKKMTEFGLSEGQTKKYNLSWSWFGL